MSGMSGIKRLFYFVFILFIYDLCLVQYLDYKIKVVEKVKKHEFEQRTKLLNINTK